MIEKLTKEQEKLMIEIADEYIDLLDACPELDEEKVRSHVEWAYQLAGQKTKPEVIFCDSPLQAQQRCNERLGTSTYYGTGHRLDLWDLYWTAYYDFFERIGVVYDCEHWPRWKEVARSSIFSSIQLEGLCFVSRMPIELHRLEPRGVMHSTEGPAIRFKDDFKLYFLWGVSFKEDLYWRIVRREISAAEILALENIEQRMVGLKYYGNKEALDAMKAKKIGSEQGYTLYEIDGFFPQKEYALHYSCPSTDREYVSFIDPAVGAKRDPIEAVASKWGLTRQQWLDIRVHS